MSAQTKRRTRCIGSATARRGTRNITQETVRPYLGAVPVGSRELLISTVSGAWYLTEEFVDRPPGTF